ncbi:MAG: hypothetical protein JNL83_29740 [Myxococcales bacterium]|nr:hypothetical protein [Myxococcales bacterium]
MSDDMNQRGPPDRSRIADGEGHEVSMSALAQLERKPCRELSQSEHSAIAERDGDAPLAVFCRNWVEGRLALVSGLPRALAPPRQPAGVQ